ncbi:MAG: extracellular solute-binding protein, partial [Simkaniaceae bacterium]|nr:extracellular solute-binding protein [Simkaniaceae bacterium]
MMKWVIRSGFIALWIALLTFFLAAPKEKPATAARTLNICSWPDAIPESSIAAFEKEYNVKVNVSYFTTNEELLTMMRLVDGREYDLVVPSDYAVKILKDEGLLKRIDKVRIKAFNEIDSFLLGYDYDKNNDYSVPIQWEALGFGIDTDYFKNRNEKLSLELLFAPPKGDYKIAMTNDPVEAINLASFYLFGHTNALTPIEMDAVTSLLIRQREWIESYNTMRPDYILATKNAPIAFGQSSHLVHANAHSSFIDFVMPDDASFLSIESLALTAATEKDDLAYT